MSCGDCFVHGAVKNSNNGFEKLVRSNEGRRKGECDQGPFSQRLGEHLKSCKLKRESDGKSCFYSLYPNEMASNDDKNNSLCNDVGEWDDICNYIGIGCEKTTSHN